MHGEIILAKLNPTILHMARDVQGNKKDFYNCISSRRKIRENLGLLLNGTGD